MVYNPLKKKRGIIDKIFFYMLVFVPVSIFFRIIDYNSTWIFITSILAILPLARYMGLATEKIAMHTNPTISAIMMSTFGNAIELMIAVFAIAQGLIEVVKASIVGSIIGNILFMIGTSMLVGGLRFKEQNFNRDSAGVSSTMLIIAVGGLALPTIYALTTNGSGINQLTMIVAVVLALIYIFGLVFTLHTHKHLFDTIEEAHEEPETKHWTLKTAIVVLIFATLFVAIESSLLVSTIETASRNLGISDIFIGIVIIALITNTAENIDAIIYAWKNKINLSLEIATSSATQIALFVVPILVFASLLLHHPFTFTFTLFEMIAMFFAVMIVNYLSADGRCNWLEGAQLLTVYLIIAVAFFFI